MKSVLDETNITLNCVFANKAEAIKTAGQILVDNGYVSEEYIGDMLKREEIVTTYVGNHVAIPHGTSESAEKINYSGISIVQVPEGVPFDDELAYIVIGIAGKNNEHLDILSKIAHVCLDEDNIKFMKNAKTKKEIVDLFREQL